MIQDLHRILPPLQSMLVRNGPSHDGAEHDSEVDNVMLRVPMAIFGAAGQAEKLSFDIAMLKRRNGFVEARDETDSFLRRALQVKGKTI